MSISKCSALALGKIHVVKDKYPLKCEYKGKGKYLKCKGETFFVTFKAFRDSGKMKMLKNLLIATINLRTAPSMNQL